MAVIADLIDDLRAATAWPTTGWDTDFADGTVTHVGANVEMTLVGGWQTENQIGAEGGPHSLTSARAMISVQPSIYENAAFYWNIPPFHLAVLWDSIAEAPIMLWDIGDDNGSCPYNPATMRWWSYRIDGTDVVYEVSPDAATWSLLSSTTPLADSRVPLADFGSPDLDALAVNFYQSISPSADYTVILGTSFAAGLGRFFTVLWGNDLEVTDEGAGVIRVDQGTGLGGSGTGRAHTVKFGDNLEVTDLGGGIIQVDVGAGGGSGSGRATSIKWGAGLTVTDLGDGIIRVDS